MKFFRVFLFCMFIVFPWMGTTSQEATHMISTTSITSLTKQFADLFSAKNTEGIGALLKDDFSLFDPVLKWLHGKDAVVDVLKKQFNETKFVEYKIINAFEDGDTGILEFQITLDDLILYGVDFIQWEEGKMKELRCYFNPPNPPDSIELKPFSNAAKSCVQGDIYEHYKGKRYKLISVARNSETLEEVVIYQALYEDQNVWSRPLRMFLENVEHEGRTVPRFKRI